MTGRFIVELQQNSGLPKQSFSIESYRSKWSDKPSGVADIDIYSRLDLPSCNVRQISNNYEVKTTIIESISWRWLYASNLLTAVELIFTARVSNLNSTPCLWLPVEAAIAVSWFLKSYWSPSSLQFNPMEHQEEQQEATSILRHGDLPFTNIAIMLGSGNNQQPCQQQDQSSESSGQHAPVATGYSTSVLYSRSCDGNEDPQQQQHTLGLKCFVQPCYGVCKFRPSSESTGPAESSLNYEDGVALDGVASKSMGKRATDRVASAGQATCNVVVFGDVGQLKQCQRIFKTAQALRNHKKRVHTGQKICDVAVFREDGQLRPCGKVYKNVDSLSSHKRNFHSGQKTCNSSVVDENGQLRPCGKLCKNADSLSSHKRNFHTGQQTCDSTVAGENGQLRPCGKLCKSAHSLSSHKRNFHTGKQICDVNVIGGNGQQQPCGTVCRSAQNLSEHKNKFHGEQKTCEEVIIGEDGQPQPCGRICKNTYNLLFHKYRVHGKQQICDAIVFGGGGRQRQCKKVCKNALSLSVHKSKYHRGQQKCDHRKRKPVDVKQDDDLSNPKGKADR
ncbi:hypothetical protein [Endozoicomonas sp. ALD040]|uniref:hypothetical protein n=1 Tax=Endozoicomonas sp. ALD040 TaxID=3403079 RepID=UPI003BB21000